MPNTPRPGDRPQGALAGKPYPPPFDHDDALTESQRIALLHRFGSDGKSMREAAARLAGFPVANRSERAN
jgi:hypothetical protein